MTDRNGSRKSVHVRLAFSEHFQPTFFARLANFPFHVCNRMHTIRAYTRLQTCGGVRPVPVPCGVACVPWRHPVPCVPCRPVPYHVRRRHPGRRHHSATAAALAACACAVPWRRRAVPVNRRRHPVPWRRRCIKKAAAFIKRLKTCITRWRPVPCTIRPTFQYYRPTDARPPTAAALRVLFMRRRHPGPCRHPVRRHPGPCRH